MDAMMYVQTEKLRSTLSTDKLWFPLIDYLENLSFPAYLDCSHS